MTAYGALVYCLKGCTYTIMGDVSQNIHYGYGLNGWKELRDLVLTGPFDGFGLLKKKLSEYRGNLGICDGNPAARQFSDLSGRARLPPRKCCPGDGM